MNYLKRKYNIIISLIFLSRNIKSNASQNNENINIIKLLQDSQIKNKHQKFQIIPGHQPFFNP